MNENLKEPAGAAPFRLDGEEWLEICRELERFHAVFYRLWEMGRPVFSDRVETAAVQFDRSGDCVLFHFNPRYWRWCTPYERLFTICHEALHVVLNHGSRVRDAGDVRAANVALDVVVNHLLVRAFGFDRSRLREQERLCWADTVFPDRGVPDDECFEHYLRLLLEGRGDAAGVAGGGLRTVDEHGPLAATGPGDAGHGRPGLAGVAGRLAAGLCEGERETLRGTIDRHFQPPGGRRAGAGVGGLWDLASAGGAVSQRKWETVILHWARRREEEGQAEEQWSRPPRRLGLLPPGLFLPCDAEEPRPRRDRVRVRFYLDTSGSCWHLRDRFFAAARSLPPRRFEAELFCFDTEVTPVDPRSGSVRGGGGTSFRAIEDDIRRAMEEERARGGPGEYPDAVFVLTDGLGDRVEPALPGRWHWFLDGPTDGPAASCLPAGSRVFRLTDFE